MLQRAFHGWGPPINKSNVWKARKFHLHYKQPTLDARAANRPGAPGSASLSRRPLSPPTVRAKMPGAPPSAHSLPRARSAGDEQKNLAPAKHRWRRGTESGSEHSQSSTTLKTKNSPSAFPSFQPGQQKETIWSLARMRGEAPAHSVDFLKALN